jgi:hypothetical protein
MADSALLIQWGAPHVGREEMGLGVFMKATEYYNTLQTEKKIEDFSIFLSNFGNLDANQGQMVIQGSVDQINALQQREDYQALLTKAAHVVSNLNVQQADTGARVMQRIEQLQVVRKELGIIK